MNPEGGKEARAHAVSPQIESGNVYLPEAAIAPWVEPFIEKCAVFPHGPYDDQVDAMTQALRRLQRRKRFEGVHWGDVYGPCAYRILIGNGVRR